MQILLSPKDSANIWIQSRMREAREHAVIEEHELLPDAAPISPLIPAFSTLASSEKTTACKLRFSASKSELEEVQEELGLGQLTLCVNEKRKRHTNCTNMWTVLEKLFLDEPVTKLCDGIFICSPYVSFVHVAQQLNLPRTAQLYTELCSKYALDAGIKRGFDECSPLLDIARMRSAVERFRGVRGVKAAREALPFVAAKAESPREAAMQLLLALPRVHGGARLPLGEFGHEVPLSAQAKKIYGRGTCRCDLFYANAKLDLEYESDQEHSGDASRKKDSRRTKALALEGIEVLTVTSQELGSLQFMEVIASMVASRLGISTRIQVKDYPLKRYALTEELLGRTSWRF